MALYELKKIGNRDFSIYHAVYGIDNIFLGFDWIERLELSAPKDCRYLLLKDNVAIGGAILHEGHITSPFLIPPFCRKEEFWQELLSLCPCQEGRLFLDFIPESYCEALEGTGAELKKSQCRMMRPTARELPDLHKDYYFVRPMESDKEEIVNVIYESHLHGYTSTVTGTPDKNKVREATLKRFTAFSKTDSLDFSTIIKEQGSDKIAAVCLAGIYPDSRNRFSTIHQVSVLPEYRRMGLARAMMLNSINTAYKRESPVSTLGVMIGNPAQKLYSSIGFIPGASYSDYVLNESVHRLQE